jgi:hypothetical protein
MRFSETAALTMRITDTETPAPSIALAAGERRQRNRAFGIDPMRLERYGLRQSRYDALAQHVSEWVSAVDGEKLCLLIVGSAILRSRGPMMGALG